MSSALAEVNENICVVCFKNVEIYSIGNCDHMVCYECSTRMRVLCRQNECPICRQDLPRVIFTSNIKPFNEIQNSSALEDKKFKICFQNKKIQDAFYKLLEHNCSICSNISSFKTFQHLYDHMKNQHNLHYCDLCVDHLKIFSSERRCYTNKDLDYHRKKGDVNDKSHRGHPLCQFCDVRYMDNDCLYRHLRRDHLYCHFCDADGLDLYYSSYDYLREHFQNDHYLCEEGTCIDEKFTPVFRTDIDLKAHKALVHGRTLGKAAAKQARTLELEFTLKPRPRQAENFRRGRPEEIRASLCEGAVGGVQNTSSKVNMPSLDSSEFPSLPSGSNSVPVVFPQSRGRHNGLAIQFVKKNAPLNMTEENFPVLGVSNDNLRETMGNLAKSSNNKEKNDKGKNGFILSKSESSNANHWSNEEQKIKIRQDDFPSLSSSNKKSQPNSAVVDWAKISNKKQEAPSTSKKFSSTVAATKPSKPTKAEDFPSLHSKFNANLNLKANESTKSNFVNVKTYKNNNKGNLEKEQNTKAASSENNWLESSDILTAATNVKAKSKKKKAKNNNAEEKSDTAKKKLNIKEIKNLKLEDKSSVNSALNATQSSETVLSKPLPRVEDWFGDLTKKRGSVSKEENKEIDDFSFTSAYPISETIQSNFDFTSQISGVTNSQNNSTEINNHTNNNNNNNNGNNNNNNNNNSGNSSEKKNFCGINAKAKKAPPPGFDAFCGSSFSKESKRPPPGFSQNCTVIPKKMTFTNNEVQNFPTLEVEFDYMPPLDFEKRNQKLVTKVNKIISNDLTLDQFRKKSILFRQSQLTAKEYFDQCMKAMDEKGMQEVFPELLVLLPDIRKQQELFQVYSDSPSFSKSGIGLDICITCHQIIGDSDAKQHFLNHSIEQNFPSLKTDWAK